MRGELHSYNVRQGYVDQNIVTTWVGFIVTNRAVSGIIVKIKPMNHKLTQSDATAEHHSKMHAMLCISEHRRGRS